MPRMVSSTGRGHFRFPADVGNSTSFVPAFRALNLGAGGQITNIDIKPSDNTTVIRTDTYGAFLKVTSGTSSWGGTAYAAPAWQQLFTTSSMSGISDTDVLAYIDALNMGCFEIAVAPSNSNIAYALITGFAWVTQNLLAGSGCVWKRLDNLTTTYSGNTNGSKERGKFIAIHPTDPNIAVFSVDSGTFRTANGLAATPTFTSLGISQGTQPNVIAWDPNDGNHLWVGKDGTGVYESTTGASGTFNLTTGTQTQVHKIECDKFSQLWLLRGTGQANIYKYASSSWSTVSIGATDDWCNIAFDPRSASSGANRIVICSFGGQPNVSANNGSTWSGASSNQTITVPATEPAWLANTSYDPGFGLIFLNTLDLAFDSAGILYNASGVGVWTTPANFNPASTQWTSFSLGIEQLIPNMVVSPPGSSPVVATWDRAFYLCQNPDEFPTYNLPLDPANIICDGWAVAYSWSDPSVVAGWAGRSSNRGCISIDGGNTYTRFATFPSSTNIGGDIAVLSASKMILFAGNGGGQSLNWTSDGGGTWTASTGLTGTMGSTEGKKFLIAEKSGTSDTYIALASDGFYKSTNFGQSFSRVGLYSDVGFGGGPQKCDSMPGQAGVYFFTSGGSSGTHPHSDGFWKNTNYCASGSWSQVGSLQEVWAFGFGAPKPGFTPYTIYAYGWKDGVLAFWQSVDVGTTWTLCDLPQSQLKYPMGALSYPYGMTGDMNVYGRIYFGVNGAGFAYVDTRDACPWVNFSNIKVKQALSGPTTITAKKSGLVPVKTVQFSVDGVNIGSQLTGNGPYSISWNASSVSAGSHTLKVEALGANGTGSFSIPITTS